MNAIEDLPEIDYGAADFLAAPLATLANFARRSKLGRSARGVEIFDYDLCREAIIDRRMGTGHPKLMKVLGLPEGPALDYKRNSISFHDRGEVRRRLRNPLVRLMGSDQSERFRGDIRHVVEQTIAAVPTHQPVDLIAGICDPIPSGVYCYWIDAGLEDAAFVSRTSHIVQQVHTRDPERAEEIVAGFNDLIDFVDGRIAAARKNPGDNLLSDLIRVTDMGELTEDELRNWVIKLAEANTDNSSHQIGIAIAELASRPDVWARLGEDPSLVPRAMREVMRYHPRSLSTSRETLEDLVLDGCELPKGTAVFPNIGAAHWNPLYYPDPQVFDIERPDKPPHLNFGGGIFSCIGRFAVTIEIEEAISLLATRFPNLQVQRVNYSHSPMFTSIDVLEGVLDPV
jgi:cytochrome P450